MTPPPFKLPVNLQSRQPGELQTIKAKYGQRIRELLIDGMNTAEVAKELGLPYGAVIRNSPPMSRIHELRGQKRIRETLAGRLPVPSQVAPPKRSPWDETPGGESLTPRRDKLLDQSSGKCPKCGRFCLLPCSNCFNDPDD